MRFSRLFGQTLRSAPSEATAINHILLARAGFIRPLAGGGFVFLPLGQRTLNRLTGLVRDELEALGGQETSLLIDIRALAETDIHSHRQLPRLLYAFTYLERDTPHPRSGLFGAIDSPALEIYSLDPSAEAQSKHVNALTEAAMRIFGILHIPILRIEANPGINGLAAQGLAFCTNNGDTALLTCPACGYTADQVIARREKSTPPAEELLPLEKVATPDCSTIEALTRLLNIPKDKTAKAIFLMATLPEGVKLIFVIVRGDMELSETKLIHAIGATSLRPATEDEICSIGAEPGYASPVGLKDLLVIIDDLIPHSPNLVAGANQHGYHLRNVNYGRDFQAATITDLALAKPGDPCPKCSQPMQAVMGSVLAHATKFDPSKSPTFSDENGQATPLWIEAHRFDLGRSLAAVVETHHDEHGILWPPVIAPYDVYLIALAGKETDTRPAADEIYETLQKASLAVLYDDRDERAGVKFKDADLIGCPLRITVGERNLQAGMVELKARSSKENRAIPLGGIVEVTRNELHVKT